MNDPKNQLLFPSQTKAWAGALLRQCEALVAKRHHTRTLGAHLLAA